MIEQVTFQEILPAHTTAMANLIRSIFEELEIPKVGTAYEDPSLNDLYKAYQAPRSSYFVALKGEKVVGGVGLAPLANYSGSMGELQKLYVDRKVRSQGVGAQLVERCLQQAKSFKYAGCYLETMPNMKAAQKLYQRYGFNFCEEPLGETGHSACHVYMLTKF